MLAILSSYRKPLRRYHSRNHMSWLFGPLVLIAAVVAATVAVTHWPPSGGSLAAQQVRGSMVPAPGASDIPAPPSGWALTFGDDFAGPAGQGVDAAKWKYQTGPGRSFGTGEAETMTDATANVHLDGMGNLDITALQSGPQWTSGRIMSTEPVASAPAGGKLEVVASIRQPAGGPGYWPSFWLLGPGQWPRSGEIDIMEDANSRSRVLGTVHCGMSPGGPCNELTGVSSGPRGCPDCLDGMHTYAMILDRTHSAAESITFYRDGTDYFTVTEAKLGTGAWEDAFDHPLSIVFDLAVGGGFPDSVAGTTTPTTATMPGGTMQIAYVAAYSTQGR